MCVRASALALLAAAAAAAEGGADAPDTERAPQRPLLTLAPRQTHLAAPCHRVHSRSPRLRTSSVDRDDRLRPLSLPVRSHFRGRQMRLERRRRRRPRPRELIFPPRRHLRPNSLFFDAPAKPELRSGVDSNQTSRNLCYLFPPSDLFSLLLIQK